MTDTVWTDERLALLRVRFEAGDSASQIAIKLGDGLTRNAVIGKLHRLDLRRGKVMAVRSVKKSPGPAWEGRARHKPSLPTVASAMVTPDDVAEPLVVPGPALVEPSGPGVSIHALDGLFEMCRWIVEPDPQRRGGDRYCGEKSVKGCSWCVWHKSLAFTKATGPNPQPDLKKKVQHKPSMADRYFGAVAW